jgi:hypothetical protein
MVRGEVRAKLENYTTPRSFFDFPFTASFSQDVEAPKVDAYLQRRRLQIFFKQT